MRKIVEYEIHSTEKGSLGSKVEKDVEHIIRHYKNSNSYGRTFGGLLKVVKGLRGYIEDNFELKPPAPPPNTVDLGHGIRTEVAPPVQEGKK